MAINVWPFTAVSGDPLYAGRKLRQTTVSPFAALGTTARSLGARTGIRPGTPNSVFSIVGGLWSVGVHGGIVDLAAAGESGAYGYAVDAAVTGAISAANATNPRWDLVYLELSDPEEAAGSGAPRIEIKYLAGTPNATPSIGFPATPARSFPLMRVVVPQTGGGSPTAVAIAPFSAAAGSFVPFRTRAELDAWTTAGLSQHATVIADPTASNNGDYSFDGTAWSRPSGLNAALSTDSQQSTSLAPNGTFVFHTSTFTITQAVRVRVIAQINVLMVLNTAIAGYVQVVVDGTVVKNRRWQNRSVANVRVSPVIAWDEWLAPGTHTVLARIVSDGGSGANADVFDGYTEVVY